MGDNSLKVQAAGLESSTVQTRTPVRKTLVIFYQMLLYIIMQLL